ncbi:MAG: DUF6252 family protein [Bacteroidales bacterium]
MKILNYSIIALCFLMINASSCFDKDDEDKLPPETQTGNNTFGCLVNDIVWLNKGQPHFGTPNLEAIIDSNEFKIIASKTLDNINQSILIIIDKPLHQGIYKLNSLNCFAQFNDDVKNCYYKTDSISSTGILEITKYDSVNKIVSGRFNFRASKYITNVAACNTCDSTINIIEGRFDINYAL